MNALSWIEISKTALSSNINTFRELIGNERLLLSVVKSNAYGHGIIEAAKIFINAGTDWLGVFNFNEAIKLRTANIEAPILVFGPTNPSNWQEAADKNIRITVASSASISKLSDIKPKGLKIHLKLETGTNRQGLLQNELQQLKEISIIPEMEIEGAYTHFADIEDTTDHSYAFTQLKNFKQHIDIIKDLEISPPILHTACSAAALLFPETLFNMARVGIGAYGMWSSKETLVSAQQLGRKQPKLLPAFTWKTAIAQIKELPAGEFVSYGRTFKTMRKSKIAVLPIGYANGYDRKLSNNGYVLINGFQARIAGRVCMNMTMVDVTDIKGVKEGDEVVLLGTQKGETITAEMMADWIRTINYEIVTRAEPENPRIVVD